MEHELETLYFADDTPLPWLVPVIHPVQPPQYTDFMGLFPDFPFLPIAPHSAQEAQRVLQPMFHAPIIPVPIITPAQTPAQTFAQTRPVLQRQVGKYTKRKAQMALDVAEDDNAGGNGDVVGLGLNGVDLSGLNGEGRIGPASEVVFSGPSVLQGSLLRVSGLDTSGGLQGFESSVVVGGIVRGKRASPTRRQPGEPPKPCHTKPKAPKPTTARPTKKRRSNDDEQNISQPPTLPSTLPIPPYSQLHTSAGLVEEENRRLLKMGDEILRILEGADESAWLHGAV